MRPCADAAGRPVARPIVWSRRNGAWRRSPVLWVGAAPGNAGGMGTGNRGAHGTRIPFGGDVAGANLDVLLAAIGLDRDTTFLTAALNHLPAKGGGEPTAGELAQPIGSYADSLHILRDTIVAAGPRLLVALGNVALRATLAAAAADAPAPRAPHGRVALPGAARLAAAGVVRGELCDWPDAQSPDDAFRAAWREAWGAAPLPALLLCYHPSAQNMSPFAAADTLFHRRMVETRAALRSAAARLFDGAAAARADVVPHDGGIHALPEWQTLIGPYHGRLIALWRERGVG
jgi:uracil-DNA glycosylase